MNSKVEKLIQLTIKSKAKYPYINITDDNKYNGWVTDFRLKSKETGNIISLNLKNENDLFLLFVLASAWSRTGQWQNAAYFVAYLKLNNNFNIADWKNDKYITGQKEKSTDNAKNAIEKLDGDLKEKNSISFRKDIYDSMKILAEKWSDIKNELEKASKSGNWRAFISFLRTLRGLGQGTNRMRIKIPLILRELRCQCIYKNIPGELCCVADVRVKKAYKKIDNELPVDYLKASAKIYKDFSDLYDIPPFAFEDVWKK